MNVLKVKSEPTVPNTPTPQTIPYFTNPVSFKQEPREMSPPEGMSEAQESARKDEDSTAISIVTHLLKDKQILNQLEKVARSFQQPSGYQGTWNFKTPSS